MPTACLREPVPFSVVTQPSLVTPPTSWGTVPSEIGKMKGENKSGLFPCNGLTFSSRTGAPTPPTSRQRRFG